MEGLEEENISLSGFARGWTHETDLVVTAACGSVAYSKLRAINGRHVRNQLSHFWSTDAVMKEDNLHFS